MYFYLATLSQHESLTKASREGVTLHLSPLFFPYTLEQKPAYQHWKSALSCEELQAILVPRRSCLHVQLLVPILTLHRTETKIKIIFSHCIDSLASLPLGKFTEAAQRMST